MRTRFGASSPRDRVRAALGRPVAGLSAGRVRVISARRTIVITWGYDRRADGGGADPHTNTNANATARIASVIAAAIAAADASSASIGQGIGRDTRDA